MKSNYNINRLIFINTEQSNYLETDLRYDILNFSSRNGVGKTSKIKTLKMLLSAEDNFANSKNKFRLDNKPTKGVDENYSNYKYYLRNNQSFIIAEHENPQGVFCQIICKSLNNKDLGLSRMFIDKSYDDIKNWFMDASTGEHIATKITNIDVKNKIEENKGVIANNKEKMKSVLFQSNNSHDEKEQERYNIIKLKDNNNTELFSSLLDMMITGLDKDTIKNIMVKICENKKSGEDDNYDIKRVNLVNSILPELNRITESILDYQNKNKHHPKYLRLKETYKSYEDNDDKLKTILYEYFKVDNAKKEKDAEYEKILLSVQEHESKSKSNNDEMNVRKGSLKEKIIFCDKEIGVIKDSIGKKDFWLNQYDNNMIEINRVISDICDEEINLLNAPLQEIKKYLNEEIKIREDAFNNIENIIFDIKKLNNDLFLENNKIKDYEKSIVKIKAKLNNEYLLMNIDDKKIFNSLNSIFAVNFSLKDFNENKNSLTNLINTNFRFDSDIIYFGSKNVGKLNIKEEKSKQEWEYEINYLENKIKESKNLILNIENKINSNSSILEKSKNESLEKELKIYEERKKVLSLFSDEDVFLKQKIHEDKNELKDRMLSCISNKEDWQDEFNRLEQEQEMKEFENIRLKEELDNELLKIQKERDFVHSLFNNLQVVKNRTIVDSNDLEHIRNIVKDSKNFDIDFAKNAIFIYESLNKNIGVIRQELDDFVSCDILNLSDNHCLMKSSELTKEEMSMCIKNLDDVFENLKEKYEIEEIQNEKNKDALIDSLSALSTMTQIVESNIKNINELIAKNMTTVSSIDQFTIDVEINPVIKELCKKIELWKNEQNNDYYTLDRYNSLIDYLRSLHNLGEEITYKDIIQNINVSFNQNGKKSASSSTGTNIITNIIFISAVFDKLIEEGTNMQLPIIIDEIGNLDFNNQKLIINLVKEKNYRLISTTPKLDFFEPDAPIINMLDINLEILYTLPKQLTTDDSSYGFENRQTYFYEDRKEIDYIKEYLNESK